MKIDSIVGCYLDPLADKVFFTLISHCVCIFVSSSFLNVGPYWFSFLTMMHNDLLHCKSFYLLWYVLMMVNNDVN